MPDALTLTIAAAQPMCRAYDVAENAVSHADVVLAAAARVVVFPELSLTGYELDAPAVDPSDGCLRPVIDACATTGSVAFETAAAQSRVWSADGAVVASAGRDVGRIAHATVTRRTAPS